MDSYIRLCSQIVTDMYTPIVNSAKAELTNGLFSMLGTKPNISKTPRGSSFIMLGILGKNEYIDREILESEKEKVCNEYYLNDYEFFRTGDKVIQTVNDYDIKVMNGSIGFISKINKLENSTSTRQINDEIHVSFIDEFEDKIYNEGNIENLRLAYGITIHKAQGSEFPIVIIPFHKSQEIMLNKNLLYTAITRAKSRLIIIGDPDLFLEYLQKEIASRNSNLIKKVL